MKKAVLKISQNSQENTCVRVSILIKCKLRTPFSQTAIGRLLLLYPIPSCIISHKEKHVLLRITENLMYYSIFLIDKGMFFKSCMLKEGIYSVLGNSH